VFHSNVVGVISTQYTFSNQLTALNVFLMSNVGHGGECAAEYSKYTLYTNIILHPEFATDPQRVIREGFIHTDNTFCAQAKKHGDKSGTTATLVIIYNNTIYAANVGDSCAILCKGGSTSVKLTTEHKASNENEKKRVKESGGLVVWYQGAWRVNGTLCVSRSIGDEPMANVVTAQPGKFQ
jgi:serine/threonine protein phosphatase PrpC